MVVIQFYILSYQFHIINRKCIFVKMFFDNMTILQKYFNWKKVYVL